MNEVYKDQVEDIISRTRREIKDLGEKLEKYTEKTEDTIDVKEQDIRILEKLAVDLPERQPKLFKAPEGTERVTLKAHGKEVDITDLTGSDIS